MKLSLLFTTIANVVLIVIDFYAEWQNGSIGQLMICQHGMAEKK